MGATDYQDLKHHVNHQINCTFFGLRENVAVVCESCDEVILDFDRFPEIVVEDSNVTPFDRENIGNIMHDKPGFDWFTCKMLRILPTCDLENREKIRSIYPDIVALFEEWKNGKT